MPVTSTDITLKSRVIMHMITSTVRRPYASTRSEPVECSSACKDKEGLALERSSSRVEWLMNDDGEVEALRSLVSLPWITQQYFIGMLQARRIDQVDVYFLFEWQRFCLWEQLGYRQRISFRKRPCAMYKDNAVGNVVAETGRDLVFGTMERLSDLSMPLTGEVRRSPEPSARPSPAADSEKRQICTRCLFAESVGLCLCFLPSCAMYKDNAVGNVVAETGRDVVFMTTARLSDLSMPLKGEVRRSPEQSTRQPIARSGKFVRRAYSRRALDCEKTTVLCFLPSWSTLLFERGLGEEGRFDVAARSETPKPSCQNHRQQLLRPRSGPSIHKPEQLGWKNSKYWANIEKRNQINTKNYWK